jgi:EAL domain-containing protein (putative c-di-GMP-specific phosphodiesterase class I)
MAHSLGLKVIAEGVENPQQLAFLAANACDEVQGYLFSRPVAAGDLVGSMKASVYFRDTWNQELRAVGDAVTLH